MTRAAMAVCDLADREGYWTRLRATVRDEFQVDVYRPGRDDSVLGPGLCRVEGCDGKRNHLTFCCGHEREWAASGLSEAAFAATAKPVRVRLTAGSRPCLVPDCPNGAASSGLCEPHRTRWSRQGQPEKATWVLTTGPVRRVPACMGPGCERPRSSSNGLCAAHYKVWSEQERPEDLAAFFATVRPVRQVATTYDLSDLPGSVQLEVQFALQRRKDAGAARCSPGAVAPLVDVLRRHATQGVSLLDQPLAHWESLLDRRWTAREKTSHPLAFLRYAYDQFGLFAGDGDDEHAKDVWDLRRLGLHRQRCPRTISFTDIPQPWLRQTAKRWAQLLLGRLSATHTVGQVVNFRVFARFLAERHPEVRAPSHLSRAVIEDYLVFLTEDGVNRSKRLSALRCFLNDCRRYEWMQLPAGVHVYVEDFPKKPKALPRFLDEHVMAQLEHPDAIAELPEDGTRSLVVVMIHTGMRAGDLVTLPPDPLTFDASGAPYLRYRMGKMSKDHQIPVDDGVVAAVRAQQAIVRFHWPDGSPWLFPRLRQNADGHAHYSICTLQARLQAWMARCNVRDRAGKPVRITTHQFRHTLGTRMLNDGVPVHVIQRMLGHESPTMTQHYARLHDQTLREAFDTYARTRVNIAGERVVYDPAGDGAEGEWMKERLARAKQTLPNGFCGRPLQQECPHPNACLTCPDFLTDTSFLAAHRDQRARTVKLITKAEAKGQFRLVEMNRKVVANLDTIIATLEALDGDHAS